MEIMELLCAISKVGTTVVVVTHEQELAAQFHQRTVYIDKGRVISDTCPVPSRPTFLARGTGRHRDEYFRVSVPDKAGHGQHCTQ